ncbi:electron transfer flavoprotein subunit alpha/FixB family protein [Sedimenticola hydrogenitrophicus]|uniref:electron transfer flavoprotein subunit alpha/FixB family protein n=1 Tax=Sedimenticola hydrogenitrophicus TaxID=2967975 RepID=UPI0023B11047|nr:FAD-binding protein [Sedimenticola hydrogenitrophicus]
MSVLIIAEHDNQALAPATLNVVTAAQQIAGHADTTVDILVAGQTCDAVAQAAARIPGIARVRLVDDASQAQQLAENLAAQVVALAAEYSHILAPATTFGKNFLPRAAALLDVSQISDISAVVDGETFIRPIFAGNALAKVRSSDSCKLITVRTTKFEASAEEGGNAAVEPVTASEESGLSSFVGRQLSQSERPELTSARIVISGGRGMQDGANFQLLDAVADKLDAAVGASRAAVDAGYVPNDFQVGQTGKVVAPDLYIAVGISGAIQHLAGMKDSKVIVAINKDSEAPIFQVADYGLVEDLFEALPAMREALG